MIISLDKFKTDPVAALNDAFHDLCTQAAQSGFDAFQQAREIGNLLHVSVSKDITRFQFYSVRDLDNVAGELQLTHMGDQYDAPYRYSKYPAPGVEFFALEERGEES